MMARPDRVPLTLPEALLLAGLPPGSGLLVQRLTGTIGFALLGCVVALFSSLAAIVAGRRRRGRPLPW